MKISCPLCDFKTSSKRSYNGHLWKHLITSCPVCGKKLKNGNYRELRKHLLRTRDDEHKLLKKKLATGIIMEKGISKIIHEYQ
ncbi:hypothetical protein [Candidatus Acidianus copahuensis]|uniref:hypothetical protein n=1 Tax=Candidatus Acidianus copahuensis TaxID=1160895 RepID=UPI0012376133|nr:hypothetical protein [Candidatus Acidianus copahuensis]